MQQDNSLNWIYGASTGIVLILIILMYYYRVQIQSFLDYLLILKQNIQFILSHIFIVLVILVLFALVSYIIFIIIRAVYREIINIKDEKEFIKCETEEIEDIFGQIIEIDKQKLTIEIEKLIQKIQICRRHKPLNRFIERLKKRKAKATELLELTNKKQYVSELDSELYRKQELIENLDKEIRAKELDKEDKRDLILWKLKTEENPVFIADDLTRQEIDALVKDNYSIISEYDLISKKFIKVLVKPRLNHSPTHAFLVWNTKKLLEKIKGVRSIRESLTKEADITFIFNNKIYALEIEKGNLLIKKNQLQAKVDYLNKKYQNRWMFIVSNKNLLRKYKKFGLATPRKGVSENLSKLLNIAHPI